MRHRVRDFGHLSPANGTIFPVFFTTRTRVVLEHFLALMTQGCCRVCRACCCCLSFYFVSSTFGIARQQQQCMAAAVVAFVLRRTRYQVLHHIYARVITYLSWSSVIVYSPPYSSTTEGSARTRHWMVYRMSMGSLRERLLVTHIHTRYIRS